MKYWPLIKILPEKTNFQFVRFSKLAAAISIIMVIGSIAMTVYPFTPPCGGLNCGVDFKGGTVLEVSTAPKPIDVGKLRSELGELGPRDVQVQAFGSETAALARFETPVGKNAAEQVEVVKRRLRETVGAVAFPRTEVVGPKVSGELFTNGILALGLAILLMLIYIWFRFELQFGIGAVIALFHDVFLTFGLFAVFKLEFTLTTVAAILTVIGYSMNDTVVVFDRLRENLRKYKRMPLKEVIDLSLNGTLSRTIITSLTGLLALVVLAYVAGETLFGFSVAMIFGIVVGTYSSVYIAAPAVLLMGVKRGEEVEIIKPQGASTRILP